MNSVLKVLFLYIFPKITLCLSLRLNSLGNKLEGTSVFARKYALSNFSYVSARSFLFTLSTCWIMLCWPACANKCCSFSLQSLGFKP